MDLRRRSPASANETSRPCSLRALEGTSRESCIQIALSAARSARTAPAGASLSLQIARKIIAQDNPPCTRQLAGIDHRVLSALSIIDAEWTNLTKVGEIAQRIGLSPSRLSHLFKKELGVSVIQFIRAVRLARSVVALADSDERVSQICYASGMNSLPAFDKSIKQLFGCSPRELRVALKREKILLTMETLEIAGSDKS